MRISILLVLILRVAQLSAQQANDNCISATNLCPGIEYSGSNIDATADVCSGCEDGANTSGNFCYELDNTVWFSFTTNGTGGTANVSISNISCLTGTGNDQELQAAIIEAGVPCDESTYALVSNCESQQSTDFILTANGLNPSTTYYIQIDGDITGSTNAAECDFSVEVSGAAVDISTTTTITDANCGASDGQIDVTNVTGGTFPYQYSIDGVNFQGSTTFAGLSQGSYTLYVTDANGCVFNAGTQTVGVSGGPTGSIAVIDDSNCDQSGEIIVSSTSGGTAPYSYSINGGAPQGSNAFSGLDAGIYQITITDASGCEEVLVATVGDGTGINSATFSTTNPTCGNSDGGIDVNVFGGTPSYSYSINGGASQPSSVFNNLPAGTYSIIVTDQNGCIFTIDNIELIDGAGTLIPEVEITATPNPACAGETVSIVASGSNLGANPNYEFFVNGVSVQNSASDNYSAVLNGGDEVTCVVTSDADCLGVNTDESNIITIETQPQETPTVNITTNSTDVCEGELVQLTANANGCSTGFNYVWLVDGVEVQSGQTSTLDITTLQDGHVVSCEVNCNTNCSDTVASNDITFTVTEISVDAGPDQHIIQGESTVLYGSGTGNLSWSPPTGLSATDVAIPTANPQGTTQYILTAENNGCTLTDTVVVYVTLPITPPNTFTPNGDGYHDKWEIFRISSYPNCEVIIYDRWGQKVFHSIGYSNSSAWDGTRNGSFLPSATYYYVIDLRTGSEEFDLITGSVTIVY